MSRRNCTKETFLKDLINADVTPVFKKDNPLLTKNYRPLSILPIVSKIFERIMRKRIIDYKNQYLLPCYVDTKRLKYTNGFGLKN